MGERVAKGEGKGRRRVSEGLSKGERMTRVRFTPPWKKNLLGNFQPVYQLYSEFYSDKGCLFVVFQLWNDNNIQWTGSAFNFQPPFRQPLFNQSSSVLSLSHHSFFRSSSHQSHLLSFFSFWVGSTFSYQPPTFPLSLWIFSSHEIFLLPWARSRGHLLSFCSNCFFLQPSNSLSILSLPLVPFYTLLKTYLELRFTVQTVINWIRNMQKSTKLWNEISVVRWPGTIKVNVVGTDLRR